MWSRDDDQRWVWSESRNGVEVRFYGRGPRIANRAAELAALGPQNAKNGGCAWAKQIHSATVLAADEAGLVGEGDALVTRTPELALTIATADCVPVMIAAGDLVAAVHAGWRGIAASVVAATADRLRTDGAGDPASWTVWLGPAMGGCCYEVGPDVAEQVAAASTRDAVLDWPGSSKPHLDLVRAVTAQLAAAGITDLRPLVSCTGCDERLWSYRRDGQGAGRNLSLIWKSAG